MRFIFAGCQTQENILTQKFYTRKYSTRKFPKLQYYAMLQCSKGPPFMLVQLPIIPNYFNMKNCMWALMQMVLFIAWMLHINCRKKLQVCFNLEFHKQTKNRSFILSVLTLLRAAQQCLLYPCLSYYISAYCINALYYTAT